jgi:hypothetical protein
VPERAGPKIKVINASIRSEVDVSESIFGEASHDVARQPVLGGVSHNRQRVGLWMIDANHALAPSPEATRSIDEQLDDRTGNPVGIPKDSKPAVAVPGEAAAPQSDPHRSRGILREGNGLGEPRQIRLAIERPHASRCSIPTHELVASRR